MNVTLSWVEVFRAAVSAVAARIRALRAGTAEENPYLAWDAAIEHACAELATRKAGVGHCVVRSTWRPGGRLVVLPNDPDAGAYALVTGSAPRYRVVGWIRGADAKTARFRAAGGYFVPQWELHTFGRAQ